MSSSPSLAVVVPAYRPQLSADELLALRHLEHFLPDTEKFLVLPETLDFERKGYRRERFAASYFASVAGYNQFVLSLTFYARFQRYDFMLIHQLDALVLGSDIGPFLELGVDYLGAPFVAYDDNGTPRLSGVGNGGLSLRRVDAFRRLLDSRVRTTTARAYFRDGYAGAPLGRRLTGLCKAGLKGLGIRNSVRREIEDSMGNEDDFIATEATTYDPGFKLGRIDQALAFAFEREPRFCFAQSGGRLPLGAHAWSRYDRAFWEPHLLT